MRNIVFDIETKNFFEDVGKNDPTLLDVSIVCLYDYGTDTFHSYLESEFSELWKRIEQADTLIGYNSEHFDIPLLNKYYTGDLSRLRSIDLMKEIKKTIGRRIALNDVAEATLGEKKSGAGGEAILWWRNGEIDKVRQYCLDDVRITKELYDYALKNGCVKYRDYGVVRDIPLDTSQWEEKTATALTHTLPF